MSIAALILEAATEAFNIKNNRTQNNALNEGLDSRPHSLVDKPQHQESELNLEIHFSIMPHFDVEFLIKRARDESPI